MADKNLTTDLTKVTDLVDADYLYAVNGGNSRAITWADIKAALAKDVFGYNVPVQPNWETNHYLTTPYPNTTASFGSATLLASYMWFFPVFIHEDRTFTTLAARITTGVAATNIGMAVYDSDGTSGVPGTLLANSGDVATTTSNTVVTATISLALKAGQKVWLCLWNDTNTSKAIAGASPSLTHMGVKLSTASGLMSGLMYRAVAFNTSSWPDPASPTGAYTAVNALPPIVGIR